MTHRKMIVLLSGIVFKIVLGNNIKAQNMDSSSFKFSGYLEAYYIYDFNKPEDHVRQPFFYAYNRHNEVNISLGYMKATYNSRRLRANLALMAGTYTNDNMAAESGSLQHLYEANIGVKLSEKKELWLDGGVLPSHIGFESAVGKDCWTLTRSLAAENSPYFETGVRLSYSSPNGKWYVAVLLLNGWQRIARANGNNTPAFGHQWTFKANDKWTFNSSSFIGNDKPDSIRRMRYFHDFFSQYQVSSKFGLIVGLDIGAEQTDKNSSRFYSWYAPIIIATYALTDKWSIAARAEKYRDKYGVIVYRPVSNGTDIYGYSLNIDHTILKKALWRLEVRQLHSPQTSFSENGLYVKNDFFITTLFAISID
ncbi:MULTISPECIES: porin [Chitinophagaceae]